MHLQHKELLYLSPVCIPNATYVYCVEHNKGCFVNIYQTIIRTREHNTNDCKQTHVGYLSMEHMKNPLSKFKLGNDNDDNNYLLASCCSFKFEFLFYCCCCCLLHVYRLSRVYAT